jgi:hypothetical protein
MEKWDLENNSIGETKWFIYGILVSGNEVRYEFNTIILRVREGFNES